MCPSKFAQVSDQVCLCSDTTSYHFCLFISSTVTLHYRPGKLNSQFIVTAHMIFEDLLIFSLFLLYTVSPDPFLRVGCRETKFYLAEIWHTGRAPNSKFLVSHQRPLAAKHYLLNFLNES